MPQTLLLADDSVTIQRVIELTFADEDIKVVAVSDGDQAIARLDAAPPDIVLADIGMPGKNGYEVAEYIKHSPRLAHIPVVLLTGAFEPVDQAKADAAGCDGVLAKPFEPQFVIGRVKELLARPVRPPAAPEAYVATPAPAAGAWAKSPVDPQLGKPSTGTAQLDEYFDRLDAAFAGLSTGSASEPHKGSAPAAKVPDEMDWFGSRPNPASAPTAPDLPLSYGALQADVNRGIAPRTPPQLPTAERFPAMPAPPPASAPPPLASVPPAVPAAARLSPAPPPPAAVPLPAPVPPPAPATSPMALPPLADAFAALLAAEQKAPPPAAAPAWPAARAEGLMATDDLVEQVVRRVLDRLSDRVVRETVAELVSSIAERLVREEIERIKASVK